MKEKKRKKAQQLLDQKRNESNTKQRRLSDSVKKSNPIEDAQQSASNFFPADSVREEKNNFVLFFCSFCFVLGDSLGDSSRSAD